MNASDPHDVALLLDAILFAAHSHSGQWSGDGHTPFVNHSIETASILCRVGDVREVSTLAAAALHDVLENGRATPAEIQRTFGSDIRRLIEEVTDPRGLPPEARRRQQLERLPRLSRGARMIRLADKIANVRILPDDWSRGQCELYLAWVEQCAAALRGTHAALEALLAQTIREARASLEERRKVPRHALPMPGQTHHTADNLRALQLCERVASATDELAGIFRHLAYGAAIRLSAHDMAAGKSPRAAGIGPNPTRTRKPRRFDDPALRALAASGARSLQIRAQGKRSWVSIDLRPEFPLPFVLSALLAIISSLDTLDTDGFVALRSYDDVRAGLSQRLGRSCTLHDVTNAIYRLRVWFQTRGKENPLLIETRDRQALVRFRLRGRV